MLTLHGPPQCRELLRSPRFDLTALRTVRYLERCLHQFRLRVAVTARNANGAGSALSVPSGIVVPAVPITNARPSVRLISVRFLGARVYARFRICDDSPRNLTILATDSRPGRVSQTRRFTTRIPPNPCGVYTRSWVPAPRFRGKGRYTVTIAARDTSDRTSLPVRKTFTLR